MYNQLPKVLMRSIALIQSLGLKESFKLAMKVLYLYCEFYINTDVRPVIKEYKIIFNKGSKEVGTATIEDIAGLDLLCDQLMLIIQSEDDVKKIEGDVEDE